MGRTTVVHLLRHGEVANPEQILYGRLPDFHLSERGVQMAELAARELAPRDIAILRSSPLERALETALPVAAAHDLAVGANPDLIEAANVFEGSTISVDNVLKTPRAWWHLRNPLRPTWGEPYSRVALRMRRAIALARREASGREAVLVSHQLPIWMARLSIQGRLLVHDPRQRQCALASITSLQFVGDELASVHYLEPAKPLPSDPGVSPREGTP
jgi:broad specificity phosphatase PhoE